MTTEQANSLLEQARNHEVNIGSASISYDKTSRRYSVLLPNQAPHSFSKSQAVEFLKTTLNEHNDGDQAKAPANVKTLLDMRIAPGLRGMPGGQIKLLKGEIDGVPSYSLMVEDQYLGSLPEGVTTDQQAILVGLGKIRELLAMLAEG